MRLLLLSLSVLTGHIRAQELCKSLPGTSGWPKPDAWHALNQSVSGRLFVPKALGAVCHTNRPEFDKAGCKVLQMQWVSTPWQALTGYTSDYTDETCTPWVPTGPCSAAGYPEYVLNATSPQDVRAGVNFARQHGIRLVVRGTGHDYLGRSSGPGSLSIFTHNIRGVSSIPGDPRATALGGIASVKMHAGERLGDLYDYAIKNRMTIIGGADPNVGIGGWTSGAGHGPLTAKYGLGADQVLEMDVVTADGRLRTVNPQKDPDLFWALRGGGAGTYGVMTSMTVKAYAPVNVSAMRFTYNTTSNSDSFWNMLAHFHTQLPHLSESGLHGYYFVDTVPMTGLDAAADGGSVGALPIKVKRDGMISNETKPQLGEAAAQSNATKEDVQGNIHGIWVGPGLTPEQMDAAVAPLESDLRNLGCKCKGGHPIKTASESHAEGDFMKFWHESNTAQMAGFPLRLGSRLLGNDSLLGDFETLKNALRTSASPPWHMLGHLVAPAPNTQRPTGGIAGGSNAVLPAWRKAYTHVVLPQPWKSGNEMEKMALTTELREKRVAALRELSPETGCYMNEADPTEPNWKQSKYGANYPRLLEIKQKYDPEGVFWCSQCVGSELWEPKGPYGINNGVGQNQAQLCRQRLNV